MENREALKRGKWWWMAAAQWTVAAAQGPMEVVDGGEDWQAAGSCWTLNANAAGTARLALLPLDPINPSTGLTCRLRWRQDFAGSTANFTRLHWLLQPDEWANPDSLPTLPVAGSTAEPTDAHLTFMHLGESGSNDSIRWLAQSSDGSWDSVVVQPSHGGFTQGLFLELEWHQPPESDTARVTVRTVFENQTTSAASCMAILPHSVPTGIGFSTQFTASNTSGASLEILQFGPYQLDSILPWVNVAASGAGSTCTVQFSEPIAEGEGTVRRIDATVGLPWSPAQPLRNEIQFLDAETLEPGTARRYVLSGFRDDWGNTSADTVIEVHCPLDRPPPRGVIISEFVAHAPEMDDWVELFNGSPSAIDIHTLQWWDGSTNALGTLFPVGDWNGVLLPHERAVITNGWEPWMGTKHLRRAEPTLPLSLHHAGESFGIRDSEGHAVDCLSYSASWWPSGAPVKHAQRLQLQGCTRAENWVCNADGSASTFGESSILEWPLDSFLTLMPMESQALAPGIGNTRFNQPLDEQCSPSIKGGWCWEGESPFDLMWRLDTLAHTPSWRVQILGTTGCWDRRPTLHTVSLETAHFPESGDLIITEIAHDPHGMSEAFGSFVELYNPSPSQSMQLDGVLLNDFPVTTAGTLPPKERMCVAVALSAESDEVRLTNHRGFTVDEVHYSRCWHMDRNKAHAGFSLVRLQPEIGRLSADASYAWDSSGDLVHGCSYSAIDPAESDHWHDMDTLPVAYGEFQGEAVVLFAHAPLYSAPPGYAWTEDTGHLHPASLTGHSQLFPADSESVRPGQLLINELRAATTGGPEPFIELLNPTGDWATTRGLHWTSTFLPFPEDWTPIHESIEWFVPPGGTLAFAACPNRISGSLLVPNSTLPSLWGTKEVQLADEGLRLDSVHVHTGRHAPWHTENHSLERQSARAQDWNSSLDVRGHTAGLPNSWQYSGPWESSSAQLRVLNATWGVSAAGEAAPVAFELLAPDTGPWLCDWRIMSAMGRSVAASSMPMAVSTEAPTRCFWDGTDGSVIAAPGPYLLVAVFHPLGGGQLRQACAVVHVSPG